MQKFSQAVVLFNLVLATGFLAFTVVAVTSRVDLAEKKTAVDQVVADLTQAQTDRQTKVDSETRRKNLRTSELQTVKQGAEARKTALLQQLATMAQTAATTQEQINTANTAWLAANEQTDQHLAEVKKLRADLAAMEAKNTELASQKKDLDNRIAQARVRLSEAANRNDGLVSQIKLFEK